jgi:hypothetical protein
MKKPKFLTSMLVAVTFLLSIVAQAQEQSAPSKIEVGVQFSSLTVPGQDSQGVDAVSAEPAKSEAGFGGRFTFNLNRHVALEAEGNFYPHENFPGFRAGGRLLQGQFGVKAGKRFGKFGVFAKARPGLVSFSDVLTIVGTETIDFNGQPFTFPIFGPKRKTYFSMDVGGVLEFYPSRRVLTRIDVGDTIIHYGNGPDFGFPTPLSNSRTTHNLQVTAGIGFRLMPSEPQDSTAPPHAEKQRRFEVGAQFSSLGLRQVEHFTFGQVLPISVLDFRDWMTLAGFGGRFTYNLTPAFALEVQTDFYPKDRFLINNGRAGGRSVQGQAGVKAGKRFEKFGIFAKARPGIISFSKTAGFVFDPTFGFPIFGQARKNYFSMDVGGVLEFYPSPRIVTRFDGGDTMIHYSTSEIPILFFPAVSFQTPAETTHNFQFSAGVGFRF